AKAIVGKMVDTAVTSAAATATDSLLGSKASSVAGLVGATPPALEATCPAGTVMVPTSGFGAPVAPLPSPGGMIVSAAKKKLTKLPDSTPPAAAGAAAFTCLTAEQAAAHYSQSSPPAPGAGSAVGAALAATPQGMLVTGAIAAAPMAGKGIKALNSRFGSGVKKENVIRDLARGRLQLKSVAFIEGSDALKEGFAAELAFIAEALPSVEGNFILTIAPESDGTSPPDTVMVRRRLVKLATQLQAAGIPEARVSVAAGLQASLTSKPSKPGAARVEITRLPEEPRQ
ncbi:MAG: hypothetical protein ACT4R6_09255, partial [Gemmatimonadaceae bacterium]